MNDILLHAMFGEEINGAVTLTIAIGKTPDLFSIFGAVHCNGDWGSIHTGKFNCDKFGSF